MSQQPDFIPVRRDPAPRHIDPRGDIRPQMPDVRAHPDDPNSVHPAIDDDPHGGYGPPCACCGSTLGCYCHEYPHANELCPGNYPGGAIPPALIADDPLPLPPGWTDADLPTDPTGPVSPTLLAAARRAGQRAIARVGIDMGEPGGDRTVYATQPHIMEAIRANLACGANDDSDGLRAELSEDARIRAALANGTYDDNSIPGSRYPGPATDYDDGGMSMSLTAAPRATEKPPKAETRYVEGIPHTEPAILPPGVPPGYRLRTQDDYRAPQGVPDAAFCRSREAHLPAQALRSMDDPGDATESAERTGEADWDRLLRFGWYVLAFAAGGALVGAVDWLRAVGRI